MNSNHHRRVLLVDDDPDVRGMLSWALTHGNNLAVDTAADGSEAIDLLRDNHYAVVVLDLMMPGIDGFGVLDAIHRGTVHEPPVVLVVSGADRATLNRLDASRIHGVVRKPFDPADVAAVVTACVEIRSRNSLGTMAMAMISSAPLIALLKL